jgi:hypothetical protein
VLPKAAPHHPWGLFIKKAREIEADVKQSERTNCSGQLHRKPPEPRNKKSNKKSGR